MALRLVFDKEQQQQQQQTGSQVSDLSQALIELSHKYGLQVELEIEGAAEDNAALAANGKIIDETMTKCAKKNNMLSTVCEKAQRLWQHQRHFFKNDENGGRVLDADCKENGADDVEKGIGAAAANNCAPDQKKLSSCSAVTVDETAKTVQHSTGGHRGGSLRYRTLEYGASPADTIAYSSPDGNVQCCTVNASDVPAELAEAAATTVDEMQTKRALLKSDETAKTSAANPPPPPPPRKYSASVVSSACAAAAVTAGPRAANNAPSVFEIIPPPSTPNTSASAITVSHVVMTDDVPLPVACSTPDSKESRAPQPQAAVNEMRVDDDYYWCTTTAMATPRSMSTFGKRQSSVDSAGGKDASGENDGVARSVDATMDDGDSGNVTLAAAASGTTSIEDASLPSLSSDGEDEENDDDDVDVDAAAVFAVKKTTKPECPTAATAVDKSSENDRADDRITSASVAIKAKPRNNDGLPQAAVSSPPESKLTMKLPTLRHSLSSPAPITTSGTASSSCCPSSSSSASSTTSSTSSSSSSPTNNGGGNLTIVSKIPVRRQSAGSNVGGGTACSTPIITNGTAKRSIPLPLSRSSSRLAM